MRIEFMTAGESHGPAMTVVICGFPSGVEIRRESFKRELSRRRWGYGRGRRMEIESAEEVEVLSGMKGSLTTGNPMTFVVRNADHENWKSSLDPWKVGNDERELVSVSSPRPGHADYAGMIKWKKKDARDIIERSSARETLLRVIAGTTAKALLRSVGIGIHSQVIEVGGIKAADIADFSKGEERDDIVEESELRCADMNAGLAMAEAIKQSKRKGDTLGGSFQLMAKGFPPGIGGNDRWEKRIDARLAAAIMSVHSVKSVNIGLREENLRGSQYHDAFTIEDWNVGRSSNRCGGVEGGISNGEPIWLEAWCKPIPTLREGLASFDMKTGKKSIAAFERSDTCVVPAAAVVGEAMLAWELAAVLMESYGGNTIDEFKERHRHNVNYVRKLISGR